MFPNSPDFPRGINKKIPRDKIIFKLRCSFIAKNIINLTHFRLLNDTLIHVKVYVNYNWGPKKLKKSQIRNKNFLATTHLSCHVFSAFYIQNTDQWEGKGYFLASATFEKQTQMLHPMTVAVRTISVYRLVHFTQCVMCKYTFMHKKILPLQKQTSWSQQKEKQQQSTGKLNTILFVFFFSIKTFQYSTEFVKYYRNTVNPEYTKTHRQTTAITQHQHQKCWEVLPFCKTLKSHIVWSLLFQLSQ